MPTRGPDGRPAPAHDPCRGPFRVTRLVTALLGATLALGTGLLATPEHAGAADRVSVVAGAYPLAWAAERVGGRAVTVRNLTPAGAEPHDLELTTAQRDAIEDADLVVVLGGDFQPAVEKAARDRDGRTLVLARRLPVPVDRDPHVWLDPSLMAVIVDEVAAALARVDPKRAAGYQRRARAVADELAALDERYRAGLARCERRLLVTTHEAFGHLAAAYDLDQEGVTGLVPDAEPDPDRLADLADLARRRGATTVFTEPLASPAVARTLAREAGGLEVRTLDPLEGLTKRRQEAGADYLAVMDRNLARLRAGLGCT